MIKCSRIAAITLLAVGSLCVLATNASAAATRGESRSAGGVVSGFTRFPPPPTGGNPDGSPTGAALYNLGDPIGLGPLNVAVPAVGVL